MMHITIKLRANWNPGTVQLVWETISNILEFAGCTDKEMEWDEGFNCPNCKSFLIGHPKREVKYCGFCGNEMPWAKE